MKHAGSVPRHLFVGALIAVAFAGCSDPAPQRGPVHGTESAAADVASRSYRFTYAVTVPSPPAGTKTLNVWVPLPMEDPGVQAVSNLRITPAAHEVTTDPVYGNRMIFVSITDPTGPTKIAWSADVDRRRDTGQGTLPTNDRYLAASSRIPLDGKAAEMAMTLGVANPAVPLRDRAKTVYDDVLGGMDYDKSVPGYGNGDFMRSVEVCKGNCTDFHARFIGVCRAGGIPARFTIGVPMKPGDGSYQSYHCWAHWYDGTNWQPTDISEADKVADSDPAKAEWYFGNLGVDRIALTLGRDITLAPAQQGGKLNYFVFPYAEADGAPLAMSKKDWAFTWSDR